MAKNATRQITLVAKQLRRWEALLALFLVWLMVEDLVRKLSGNDIRIFFVKDALFAVLLISLWRNSATRGLWRAATGRARWTLYVLIGYALVMAIPSALHDWRLAVVGLRLDFFYLPLVVAGFLLARHRITLGRALLFMSLLGAAASAVGIVQAILGPSFLAPDVPTPGLGHLVNIHSGIYQPTGTFVDPGRFHAMTVIAVAAGIASLFLNEGRLRAAAAFGLVFSLAAVWVSGGRVGLLLCAAMLGIAAILFLVRRRRATLAIGFIGVGATVVLAALSYSFPEQLAFYWASLNPLSSTNEWAFRWNLYTANTLQGIHLGGLFGRGTGQESLGKQYLYGGANNSIEGLYQVEGGYAAIAVELGIVGVLLWLTWTVTWTARQLRWVWALRGNVAGSAGFVLLAWIVTYTFVQFAAGLQYFQNYYASVYFWLLSGIVFGLHQATGASPPFGSQGSYASPHVARSHAKPALATFSPRLIVLAPDPWGIGGVQQVTRTLLSSLADLYGADRIGVLQLWDHGTEPTPWRLLYRGVPTVGKATGRVTLVMRARYLLATIQHARRWQDNLMLVAVHAHLAPAAWIAAKVSRRPYAVWCHGLEVWEPMGPVMRVAMRNAAVIFTSNHFTASRVEQLAGLGPGKVDVFPHGLPSGYVSGASTPNATPTVLAVARLAPEDAYKGVDSLICAWPQVLAQVPEARLEIVGDGPDRPRLMKMAETFGLVGTVHFAGRLPDEDLRQAYARATVFAMPGRHSFGPPAQGEGFGMVFVEAGAAGLPVVAGRSGGASEAVDDEESGLLVEPNEPTEIAAAIVRLLKDPELARRLGRAGRERAEGRFSYGVFKGNVDLLVQSVARHAL